MVIGTVLKSKSGANYIKLGQPRRSDGTFVEKNVTSIFPIKLADGTTLNENDALFLKDPRVAIDELVAAGYITAETAEERKNKIPSYVRFRLEVAAKKD